VAEATERTQSARTRLVPRRESVSAARAFVKTQLANFPRIDTAVLLTSELVTKAILHAATDVELLVKRTDRSARVVVRDSDRRQVFTPYPSDSAGDHGRGLFLVANLATRWGQRDEGDGKSMWFELDT